MKQSIFDKLYCSSAYCRYGMDTLPPVTPETTMQDVMHALRDFAKIPVVDMTLDNEGNYWCKEPACQRRRELMNWGKAHNWQAITCPPYAIAQGRDIWLFDITIGTDAYMQTLAEMIAAMEAS